MNTNSQDAACAAFPIRDYEQLEAELNTVRLRLAALQPHHAAMAEELDRITRPEPEHDPGHGHEHGHNHGHAHEHERGGLRQGGAATAWTAMENRGHPKRLTQ